MAPRGRERGGDWPKTSRQSAPACCTEEGGTVTTVTAMPQGIGYRGPSRRAIELCETESRYSGYGPLPDCGGHPVLRTEVAPAEAKPRRRSTSLAGAWTDFEGRHDLKEVAEDSGGLRTRWHVPTCAAPRSTGAMDAKDQVTFMHLRGCMKSMVVYCPKKPSRQCS